MTRLSILVISVAACTGTGAPSSEPAPATAPATATPTATPTTTTPTTPATSRDRTSDPSFALREIDGKYVGRVAQRCPWVGDTEGAPGTPSNVVPPIKQEDYKLVGHQLEVRLPYGGCPRWAGYTVVTGHNSPLPFYVCHETGHDTCEMDGMKTWTFDIGAALAANNATAVTFEIPDGVH